MSRQYIKVYQWLKVVSPRVAVLWYAECLEKAVVVLRIQLVHAREAASLGMYACQHTAGGASLSAQQAELRREPCQHLLEVSHTVNLTCKDLGTGCSPVLIGVQRVPCMPASAEGDQVQVYEGYNVQKLRHYYHPPVSPGAMRCMLEDGMLCCII